MRTFKSLLHPSLSRRSGFQPPHRLCVTCNGASISLRALIASVLVGLSVSSALAQSPATTEPGEPATSPATSTATDADEAPPVIERPAPEVPENAVALNRAGTILLDRPKQRLLLKGQVVFREGPLEMFLCRAGTKEHESIISVKGEAKVIHAGLLAVGAEPGMPVTYDPEFKPPTGPVIDIYVRWIDAAGKPQRVQAQQWIRHSVGRYFAAPLKQLPKGLTIPKFSELRYDDQFDELSWYGRMTEKERDDLLALSSDEAYQTAIRSFFKQTKIRLLKSDWVFAGSRFITNKEGERYYLAETGTVICVANFADAMLDLAIPSSDSDGAQLFEANTDRIPELGTNVLVELVPRVKQAPAERAPDVAKDAKSPTD